jgi:ankyrin repeat protein
MNTTEHAIRLAARRGELSSLLEDESIKTLVRELATNRDSDGRTLLYDAVVGGDVRACQYILDLRNDENTSASDVNMRDDGNWSPLMSACSSNKPDVAAWLLEEGATLDECYRDVFLAASKGDERLMRMLEAPLPGGLDVGKLRDAHGATLLHRAVGAGNERVIAWLVSKMGDDEERRRLVEDVKDGAGSTVMDVLAEAWHADERERVRRVLCRAEHPAGDRSPREQQV